MKERKPLSFLALTNLVQWIQNKKMIKYVIYGRVAWPESSLILSYERRNLLFRKEVNSWLKQLTNAIGL